MRRIGIDLANGGVHTAVVAEDANLLGKPFRFSTTRRGIELLIERGRGETDEPVEFVTEPTGNMWTVVASCLEAEHQILRLVKTQKSADLRKFFERHCKTDGVDAGTIARVPMVDPKGAPVHQPVPPAVLHLRRLVKQRFGFVKQATTHKLRMNSLVQLAHPHLFPALGDDKFCVYGKYLMRWKLDAVDVVRKGRKHLEQRLRRLARVRLSAERLDKIWIAYETTASLYEPLELEGCLPFDPARLQAEAQRELGALEFAGRQIESLDREIEELYKEIDPSQVLTGIPGLGPVLAATIEALSNPIYRFVNVRKYSAFCGVVPRRRQTGKTPHDREGLPMTKAGQRLLKRALRLGADVARRHDPLFAKIYAEHAALGWHHERILGMLAHKLARCVYAVLCRRDAAVRAGEEPKPYSLHTPEGDTVDRREARAYITERYPSKRRQAQNAKIGAVTANVTRTVSGPPSEDDATRRVALTAATHADDALPITTATAMERPVEKDVAKLSEASGKLTTPPPQEVLDRP
jgi:transposase